MSSLVTQHWPLEGCDIPDGWELVALQDFVADIQSGFASGKHNRDGNGIPHLRPMNISPDGKIDLSDGRFVDPEKSPLRLRRGDVLFNNTNSPAWVGKTAFIDTDVELAFSNHMTRVRLPEGIDPTFIAKQLQYYCRSGYFQYQCKKHVNQASISRTFLGEATPFMLPPAPEQERIFSAIESLQARSSRARDLLGEVGPLIAQLRQSVLRSAFSGRLTADWRKQNPDVEPASELLARIRTERRERWEAQHLANYEAKDNKPPKGWREKYQEPDATFDEDAFDADYRIDAESGWEVAPLELFVDPEKSIPYGIVKTGPPHPNGIPTVRGGDIKRFSIADDLKLVDPKIHNAYKRTWLDGGEVIIAIRGTVGETAVVPPEMKGMNISREVALIPVLPGVDSKFLMYLLASPAAQRLITGQVKGVAQSGINLSDLRMLPTPLPPLDEQLEIAKRIEEAMVTLGNVLAFQASVEFSLTQLDQSILAKAFRGELVPQDPRDEPASELLARIRNEREARTEDKKTRKMTVRSSSNRKKPVMPKSRFDEDVRHQPYLAGFLKDADSKLTSEDLFQAADLPLADFYKQLAWEVDNGHIAENSEKLEAR